MLPPEQRAATAQRLSVAGSPAWVPARAAYKFARDNAGVSVRGAGRAVLEYARLGFVVGRAVLAQRLPGGMAPTPSWEEREWDVPAEFWRGVDDHAGHASWEQGSFEIVSPGPGGFAASHAHGMPVIRLSGVHFLAESLQVLRPADPTPIIGNAPAAPPAKAGARGRPPQPWWDDLWCAVWGLIHQGDLKPDTQADVERAMLAWAAMNGHDLSESAVKPKARKLFQTFKGEVTNFLDP